LTPHFKWPEMHRSAAPKSQIGWQYSLALVGRIVHHCISTSCAPGVPPPPPILNELAELILRGELQALIEFLSTPNLLPF